MYKYSAIIIKIICVLSLLAFTAGCDNQAEAPQTPKVVTKKIVVAKTAKKPVPAKPAAKPAPQTKQKVTQPKPVPAKPQTAKTASPVSTAVKQPGPAVEKKPVPSPAQAPVTSPPVMKKKPEVADIKKGVEKTEQQPTGQTVELAKTATSFGVSSYELTGIYSPAGKVDPFLPLFEEKPAAADEAGAEKKKKKRRMPLTPLERVDLSQLKLVGVIQAPSGNKALVEEASGKGYIIKKGTFIGIHAGRVLEIKKDRVVVEEEVENVLGQYTLEKKELKLQKPPGEF
jgi:type IV pilus assembly protein PilP